MVKSNSNFMVIVKKVTLVGAGSGCVHSQLINVTKEFLH